MVYYGFENGCYGTKMRSIVSNVEMIDPVLEQQFKFAEMIYENNLMPIVEPEIDINNPNKSIIEDIMVKKLKEHLNRMKGRCILKLTIPDLPNTYLSLTDSHSLIRLVGLSGGYTIDQACLKLSLNRHMQASFSRALSQGLFYSDPDDYFETAISSNIAHIKDASMRG
jgi:fructose-bisphosphate aldolase class I